MMYADDPALRHEPWQNGHKLRDANIASGRLVFPG